MEDIRMGIAVSNVVGGVSLALILTQQAKPYYYFLVLELSLGTERSTEA